MVLDIIETVLGEVKVEGFVPCIARVVIQVIDTAEVGIRVGFRQGVPQMS